jgi:predicted RNase H-like HicB family nuclease
MKTYDVCCELDEAEWWAVRVPELPGTFTQGRTLTECAAMAREVIGLMLEANPAHFDVRLFIDHRTFEHVLEQCEDAEDRISIYDARLKAGD